MLHHHASVRKASKLSYDSVILQCVWVSNSLYSHHSLHFVLHEEHDAALCLQVLKPVPIACIPVRQALIHQYPDTVHYLERV